MKRSLKTTIPLLALFCTLVNCKTGENKGDGGDAQGQENLEENLDEEIIAAEEAAPEELSGDEPTETDEILEENAPEEGGGAEPIDCMNFSGHSYGGCDMILGYGYDSTSNYCTYISGCGCEPDCDSFFSTGVECAASCQADGQCNLDKTARNIGVVAANSPDFPIQDGDYCDEIVVCGQVDEDLSGLLEGFNCITPEQGGFCSDGTLCQITGQLSVDAALMEQICSATLIPWVSAVKCFVFGALN